MIGVKKDTYHYCHIWLVGKNHRLWIRQAQELMKSIHASFWHSSFISKMGTQNGISTLTWGNERKEEKPLYSMLVRNGRKRKHSKTTGTGHHTWVLADFQPGQNNHIAGVATNRSLQRKISLCNAAKLSRLPTEQKRIGCRGTDTIIPDCHLSGRRKPVLNMAWSCLVICTR